MPTPIVQEADGDQLAAEAYAEMDGKELPAEKKPDEKEAKPVEEQPAEEESKPSTETEQAEPTEEKEAEEEKEQEEKPAETEEAKPEGDEKPAEKSEEEIVNEHALKHSMTHAEAREDLDKAKAIVEKYKNDPLEMARALRQTQSAYDKIKSQEEKPKSAPIASKDQIVSEIKQYSEKNSEAIVKSYRKNHPNRTELMTDEAILEWSQEDALRTWETWATQEKGKLKNKADSKREEMISSVSKDDVPYIADIKAILSKTPDHVIVDENFTIEDTLRWARGDKGRYQKALKDAEERGFKRGQEGAKILGVKKASDGAAKPKTPNNVVTNLNKDQKSRAEEMFPSERGYTSEQAHKEYVDLWKDELKKDKNFIG